jgi:CBS-domain-containing membrane protein
MTNPELTQPSAVRQAADHLVNHDIGRLPVVRRDQPGRVVGIVTRSDILSAFRHRATELQPQSPIFSWPWLPFRGKAKQSRPAEPV